MKQGSPVYSHSSVDCAALQPPQRGVNHYARRDGLLGEVLDENEHGISDDSFTEACFDGFNLSREYRMAAQCWYEPRARATHNPGRQ